MILAHPLLLMVFRGEKWESPDDGPVRENSLFIALLFFGLARVVVVSVTKDCLVRHVLQTQKVSHFPSHCARSAFIPLGKRQATINPVGRTMCVIYSSSTQEPVGGGGVGPSISSGEFN